MPSKEETERHFLVDINQTSKTRDLILIEAAILFAKAGYAAVTMRDIAERVNIKAASIYKHFKNKEDVWNAVLKNIQGIYLLYYDRLARSIAGASSFAEVLERMFTELKEVVHIFTYYGGSLVQTEQFRDPRAYEVYRLIFNTGCESIEKHFRECIEKGWVGAFDTETVATFFMSSVFVGITARVHEDMLHETPYSVTTMFESLQRFILSATDSREVFAGAE